jgi:hypothetical protein
VYLFSPHFHPKLFHFHNAACPSGTRLTVTSLVIQSSATTPANDDFVVYLMDSNYATQVR